jgi:hypothetical protein
VVKEGKRTDGNYRMFRYEGVYDGVNIVVSGGKQSGGGTRINSAFPSWNQL